MANDVIPAAEIRGDSAQPVNLGTILIVEDDPRMQKVLRKIFTDEHYSVVVAGDGRTAPEVFRNERPIAVVLDLILPYASGRELCQTFKNISSETSVVILSAITEVV